MAIQTGYSRYQCDCTACTKRGYLMPGSQGAAEYVECQYLDSNNQMRKPVLCQTHAAQLTQLKQYFDTLYDAFIKDGSLPEGVTQ